jgi:hypothetical protein
MVATALVDEGQKSVTMPLDMPACLTESVTCGVMLIMSALPRVSSDIESVLTVILPPDKVMTK